MVENKTYLGIDVGGTNLGAGLCDQDGALICEISDKTPQNLDNFVKKIKKIISKIELIAKKKDIKIKAVGIRIPGLVDYKKKKILSVL